MLGEAMGATLGEHGSMVIDDAAAHNDVLLAAIICIEATTLTSITVANMTNSAGLVGVSLPAGFPIYGRITDIQLASGSVLGYKMHPSQE